MKMSDGGLKKLRVRLAPQRIESLGFRGRFKSAIKKLEYLSVAYASIVFSLRKECRVSEEFPPREYISGHIILRGNHNLDQNGVVLETFTSDVSNENIHGVNIGYYKPEPVTVGHPQRYLDTFYLDERLDCLELFIRFLLSIR